MTRKSNFEMLIKLFMSFLFFFNNYICISNYDNCYLANTKIPFSCKPKVWDMSKHVTVESTNTCVDNDKVCLSVRGRINKANCFTCNQSNHSINKILDKDIDSQKSFWVSDKVNNNSPNNVVNITANLENLYEIDFIILTLCGEIPDGVILYYSSDYGVTYKPWNYLAFSCKNTFKMPKFEKLNLNKSSANLFQPFCISLRKELHKTASGLYKTLPYNPMKYRSNENLDEVKKWITITNFKISLVRKKIYRPAPQNNLYWKKRKRRSTTEKNGRFCVSKLVIVGRMQCHGHASSVKNTNRFGRQAMKCNCQHKTVGVHCERCNKTHQDQMWHPAWYPGQFGGECRKCFCNNHSQICSFNSTIWKMAHGIHGSQCINCQDNTMGMFCQKCSPGYYRDPRKPMSHKLACKKCNCHKLGTINRICNPINGKCSCKLGVGGKHCNHCRAGYKQTNSWEKPCAPTDVMINEDHNCNSCAKRPPRISKKRYCRYHLMMTIKVETSETNGRFTKFEVKIYKIWRYKYVAYRVLPYLNQRTDFYEEINYPIWVLNSDLRCDCVNLEIGNTYLVLTKVRYKYGTQYERELVINQKSLVVKWRKRWMNRLEILKNFQPKCKAMLTKIRHMKKRRKHLKDNLRRRYSKV